MISPAISETPEPYAVEPAQRPTPQPALAPPRMLKPGRSSLVFDIETGPADLALIKSLSEPYSPPQPPGDFDPRSVRTGNLKDPEKIMAKIEEARQSHAAAVASHASSIAAGEDSYWAGLIESAPLSPILGRVLAIGFCDHMENTHTLAVGMQHDDDAEAAIIDDFWCDWFVPTVRAGYSLIGHYISGFDLPFLMRRSWILGVDIPPGVMESSGRYLSKTFIDTKQIWECGARGNGNVPGSLDVIGRAFGEGCKTEGMTGADFWKLFCSGEAEKVEAAIEYLRNDVVLNSRVARRMGLM